MSQTDQSAVPLTGQQYEIAAGDYAATITELGAGLRRLRFGSEPLIVEYEADELPPAGAGQLLAPWPNRIDHGRYDFAGASHQLPINETAHGNAIHGLTRWTGWDAASHAPDRVELGCILHGQPGYPFCLALTAAYQVSAAAGLEVTITAVNAGSRPAPYGTGSHHYLSAGPPLIDDCELQLPAARWLPADSRGIPAGPSRDIGTTPFDFRQPRRIAGTGMDDAFTGLARNSDGRAWVRLAGPQRTLGFWAGRGYDWLQVFTGDGLGAQRRRALAIEPMTCPANAFVTGTDLITLEPGASSARSWGIQVLQS